MTADAPPKARIIAAEWAENLLRELAAQSARGEGFRVTAAGEGLACLLMVWPSGGQMPTLRGERRTRGGRERCRADIMAAIGAAGRPLTRKEVARSLKDAGLRHGIGTLAKALADLTATRALVNPRDKRGYRLPGWIRPNPTLFGEVDSITC